MIFFSGMNQRGIRWKRLYPILQLLGKDGKGGNAGRVRLKTVHLPTKQRAISTTVEYFFWREGKHSTRGLSWVSFFSPVRVKVHGKVGCIIRTPEKIHLEGFL